MNGGLMQDDTSDERPIYVTYRQTFRGQCEGGPIDGQNFFSHELTAFFPRKVKNKPAFNGRSVIGLSEQQHAWMQEQEKAAMKEAIWARENPHRYDFDQARQVWVYVEYPLSSLEEG